MKTLKNILFWMVIFSFFILPHLCFGKIVEVETITLIDGRKIVLLGDDHGGGFSLEANLEQQNQIFKNLEKMILQGGSESVQLLFEDPFYYDMAGDIPSAFTEKIVEEVKGGVDFGIIKWTKFKSGFTLAHPDVPSIDVVFERKESFTTWLYNIVPKIILAKLDSPLKKLKIKSIDPRNRGKMNLLFSRESTMSKEDRDLLLKTITRDDLLEAITPTFWLKMNRFLDSYSDDSKIKQQIIKGLEKLKRYESLRKDMSKSCSAPIVDIADISNILEHAFSTGVGLNDVFIKSVDYDILREILESDRQKVTVVAVGSLHGGGVIQKLKKMDLIQEIRRERKIGDDFNWETILSTDPIHP